MNRLNVSSSSDRLLRVALLAVLLAVPTSAAQLEVPYLAGRVNDTAGMLSLATVQSIEAQLKTHEDSTSNQVVVLTIASLGDESIEEFSIRVAETWKLGQKGKDNGVLLLVARDDRKVRIEVGRGLEGDLTDALCSRIIRNEIVPQFKAGEYDRGVQAGVDALLAAIAGSYTAEGDDGGELDTPGLLIALTIFTIVVGTFTVIALATPGCGAWFLYAFLLPFWLAFPVAILGSPIGPILFGLYAIGFPLVKLLLPKTSWGKTAFKSLAAAFPVSSSSHSGGSSGSSFSGGGGSFSGGGSSGSW